MDRRKKKRIRRRNAGYRRLILSLIMLCMVIIIFVKLILPATVTFSRYVYRAIRNFYFNSVSFYFNSDKLAEDDSARFEADNWSGADTYSVTINMNSRKNISEVSKVDIKYNIKATCQVFNSDGTEKDGELTDLVNFVIAETEYADYDASEGINRNIGAATNVASFDFSITLQPNVTLDNGDYVYVTVTTQSTDPYEKTLTGTFKIIVGKPGLSYQIDDAAYDPYCSVIVTNTRDYYTVDEAFTVNDSTSSVTYQSGSTIDIETYLTLSDEDKAKCHSMKITLSFDPNIVVLDTASVDYATAKSNNLVTYTNIEDTSSSSSSSSDTNSDTTTNTTTSYQYVNSITFNLDAEESKVLKFYKITASNDYTYPTTSNSGETATPVVTVTSD